MSLRNHRTGERLAENVEIADNFWSRLRGLMFRMDFEDDEALLFKFSKPLKYSVHTFFVFFPIDLVYLDQEFEVVEVETNLDPWSIYRPSNESSYLLELPKGKAENVESGDTIISEHES